jgi:hypothetical protein
MQKDIGIQVEQLQKVKKEPDDAQEEANDTERGAITMFNESKRYESHIERLQSEIHQANEGRGHPLEEQEQ